MTGVVQFAFQDQTSDSVRNFLLANDIHSLASVPTIDLDLFGQDLAGEATLLKAKWLDLGLKIDSIQGFFYGAPHDLLTNPARFKEAHSYFESCVVLAKQLGAEKVIVGAPALRKFDSLTSKKYFIEAFRDFSSFLKDHNIRLLLENLSGKPEDWILATPAAILEAEIEHMQLCLDVGNLMGEWGSGQSSRIDDLRTLIDTESQVIGQVQVNIDNTKSSDWASISSLLLSIRHEHFLESSSLPAVERFLAQC